MSDQTLFSALDEINRKPDIYAYYTAPELWCDPYLSTQMLKLHLDPDTELASQKEAFIDRSVEWIYQYFQINRRYHLGDFGCGPRLYTSRFAKKGATVTGIDFSRNSIHYAKKTG